jgi:hypothetical protein
VQGHQPRLFLDETSGERRVLIGESFGDKVGARLELGIEK